MNKALTLLFFSALLGICAPLEQLKAQTIHDSEGVRWERTLRIQGVIQEMDPFSESMLYQLDPGQAEDIEASPDNVHFEVVASNFWYALRDSIDAAFSEGRINGYTVQELDRSEQVYGPGTQVTYTDFLDSMSVYLDEEGPDDDLQQILNLQFNDLDPYNQYIGDMQFDAQQMEEQIGIPGEDVNRFVFDMSMFSMFELEMTFRVDETGFQIIPKSLLLGPAIWDDAAMFDPDNLLSGFRSDFGNGIGLYIDLTEEETLDFLIETGVQYSGETNAIPFYDLMTIFHYDFNFYAESDNILSLANQFDYEYENVISTVMNRYVDFAYTNLYGQPPSWWQMGEKGHFINGLYENTLDGEGDPQDFQEDGVDDELEEGIP